MKRMLLIFLIRFFLGFICHTHTLTLTLSLYLFVAAVVLIPARSLQTESLCLSVFHQACYGIQKVPKGSWLCRICALGILPKCQLCPKKGGAMKPTRSGTKWVHVSCALWIPEVKIPRYSLLFFCLKKQKQTLSTQCHSIDVKYFQQSRFP